MQSTLLDPFWRWVFVRVLAAGLVVVGLSLLGPGYAVAGAALAAIALARGLTAEIRPLRERVLALGGSDAGEQADLRALARSVDETREQIERSERKAELEREELLGVLEATSEGILVLGRNTRVELLNDAARRMLSPPVEPLGRSLPEVARHPDVIAFGEALCRGESPAPARVEMAYPGGPRSVHLSGALVQGTRARGRAVVVLHDLTDMRHLEQVRTDFVANVTHEMRSPLSSILGYAETLADDRDAVSSEGRDHVERIVRNARRLDDIIRDLIELSRLEHATAPEAEPTNVEELVRGAVEAIQDRADEKRIDVRIEVADLPPRLQVDPGLLHQALSNLLDNAVKYTPEGGRVRVSGATREGGPGDAAQLTLAVEDSGPGIPPEHVTRIFERFYRVDTARSRAIGGTGLGLAIVKHAAALHGGQVRVDSSPGDGTTFYLELPVAPTPIG
ncbi:MAG: ATP-binding protein [Planctomycetota bacterium]